MEELEPYFIIYGARKAELSKITPFDYIEIFFALILGWIFFQEWPIDKLFPGALIYYCWRINNYLATKKEKFFKRKKSLDTLNYTDKNLIIIFIYEKTKTRSYKRSYSSLNN